MGNLVKKKKIFPVFEEVKKDYFTKVREHLNENLKEIQLTFSANDKTIIMDEYKENNNWRNFLKMKLDLYRIQMNVNTIYYLDNVIEFIENLDDFNLAHKLKLFLSNEIDESRSKTEKVNEEKSAIRNQILMRSVDYIYYDLCKLDHPIYMIIRVIIFNFTQKYEIELENLKSKININVKHIFSSRESRTKS